MLNHAQHNLPGLRISMLQTVDIKHISSPSQITAMVSDALPEGNFKRLLLKPNWVNHSGHEAFPIDALVTSSLVLDAVLAACLRKYSTIERIIVGDVPLQSCNWSLLRQQAGLDRLEAKYTRTAGLDIRFLDLRKERYVLENGFLVENDPTPGDPAGYAEVSLDERSLLEEVIDAADRFRVSDYHPSETLSSHRRQCHRYLVPKSVLESDLVINIPKMKTHKKMGITGALKNLIGINGEKSRLCTHRLGCPSDGGDEFAPDSRRIFLWQTRIRSRLQKTSPMLFRLLRRGWAAVKYIQGIKTVGTRENLQSPNFYVGPGAWYGNDSVWRVVYDLQMVLLFAPPGGGVLEPTPQRRVLHVLDAITAGEGNGPLEPLPVEVGLVMASENPFLIDFCMAKTMGFDWRKIRALNQYSRFPWSPMADITPESFEISLDGVTSHNGIEAIPVVKDFLPAPGWKNHIEFTRKSAVNPMEGPD